MARRSLRGSVYNKRSNEQVQAAKVSGQGGGGIIPQAYAQPSNPTQNQSPQARTQSTQFDPLARVSQFVQNVGRGAYDTGRSYTTDIADTAHAFATGREQQERSYREETLATVFGRGLFEGNLEGSFAEASRRVQEQPGRVVGEVATETAIMLGTMGFGAALKGAKIGATAAKSGTKYIKTKSTAGVSKTKIGKDKVLGTQRVSGYERMGSRFNPFSKGSKEFISGDFKKGHTLTIKTDKKGKETAKLTKDLSITGWTRGITARSTRMGEGFAQSRFGRRTQNVILPTVAGGSGASKADGLPGEISKVSVSKGKVVGSESGKFADIDSEATIGYMQQYEQFQAGQLPRQYVPGEGFNISLPQKNAGLFEGVAESTRSPVKGRLEFESGLTRITGMQKDDMPTGVLDASDINPFYYKGSDGTYYAGKLDDVTRPVADKLVKKYTSEIKKDTGLKAARERNVETDMIDPRDSIIKGADPEDALPMNISFDGSPNSIPTDKNVVTRKVKEQIHKTLTEGGDEAEAKSKADKIIEWYRKETIRQDENVAKEVASEGLLSPLGTPADDVGTRMTRFNLIDGPSVTTDASGSLVKKTIIDPIVFGENYGNWGKAKGYFDDANKAMFKLGGETKSGPTKVGKDQLNEDSVSNQFDSAADYMRSLEYFGSDPILDKKDIELVNQYRAIKYAKPGSKAAQASEQARQSMPEKPEQFMLKFGLSKKEMRDLFYNKGWGGTVESAQKEVAKSKNRTPQSGSIWNKKPQLTVESVRARKQTELTRGDMSGIKIDPYEPPTGKWTPEQIKQTGINPPAFVKDEISRITSPGYIDKKTGKFVQEDVESILTSMEYEQAPRTAGPRIFQSVDMRNIGFSLGKTRDTIRNTRYSGATGKPINMDKLRAKGKKNTKPKKLTNDDLFDYQAKLNEGKGKGNDTTKPKKMTSDQIWAKFGKQDWSDFTWEY
jgi:hypothetical protein